MFIVSDIQRIWKKIQYFMSTLANFKLSVDWKEPLALLKESKWFK